MRFQNPFVGYSDGFVTVRSPVVFEPRVETRIIHDSDYRGSTRTYGSGKTKYGNIKYQNAGYTDYSQQRENSRGVYHESLIAQGMAGRFIDSVINTGLTRECSPLWDLIPEWKERNEEEKYQWTEHTENLFTVYANSTEADYRGRLTFYQIERLLYLLAIVEGEFFAILKYLNPEGRTSPLAIQILNNDQVQQPYDGTTLAAIKSRGNTCEEGIEYNSAGKMIAIFVKEDLNDWDTPLVRIPVEGPKTKRRFVIHYANFEAAEQFRGTPEFASLVYELDGLVEYDINEMEAVKAGSLWMGVVETEKGAKKGKPKINPAGITAGDVVEVSPGISEIQVSGKALIQQNLDPGQTFKGFQPNRPNPNYAAYEDVIENRVTGSRGMPLSVHRQKFQASYSAARAEILFYWNNVERRRDDFAAGALAPFFEAWFSEHVKAGNIKAPGFNTLPVARQAWLYGTWNGISRPVVDPVKEVNAVEKRQELGHTTGEREAKAYNGSDYRENIKRLKTENELRADANSSLNPAPNENIPQQQPADSSDGSDTDQENK